MNIRMKPELHERLKQHAEKRIDGRSMNSIICEAIDSHIRSIEEGKSRQEVNEIVDITIQIFLKNKLIEGPKSGESWFEYKTRLRNLATDGYLSGEYMDTSPGSRMPVMAT